MLMLPRYVHPRWSDRGIALGACNAGNDPALWEHAYIGATRNRKAPPQTGPTRCTANASCARVDVGAEYSPACPLGGNAECIRDVYIVCVYIAVGFQARVAGRVMYVVYTSRCILGN